MKPRKLVAGMTAATALVILLMTLLFKDEIRDWLFAIRRVRTWGDLLAQQPLELADGVVVRLGIEDTRCPQGSGVLLYCLTEGYDPSSPRIGSHHTDDGLGPLEVSVVEEGAVLEEQKSEIARSVSLWKKTTARLLFARSIPVPRSGRYHVTVSEGGKALRHVTVKGTDESAHTWLTLEESPRPNWFPYKGSSFLGTFVPCHGSAVILAWEGFRFCMEADTRVEAARGLPWLLPDADAKPELDLRMEESSLIVTSTSKIPFMSRNFAARWWVNGIPHIPRAPKLHSRIILEDRGPKESERSRFELDFAASSLDLRSGDRVSLQLMYSDEGLSFTYGWWPLPFLDGHRMYSSNRIDLTVP